MRLPVDPEAVAAEESLNATVSVIWARRPQAFDHKGKLIQNAQMLASHLADGVIEMITHVVNITYERYKVTELLAKTPTHPKPLMPSRNMASRRGWDHMTDDEFTACKIICRWRVSQIWFGANTPESLRDFTYVSNQLTELAAANPEAFD